MTLIARGLWNVAVFVLVPGTPSPTLRGHMIDVALTPADMCAADVTVVIDVLRMTSTATQALASGYRAVRCVDSLDHALALRGPGRVLAGERCCVPPAGFDQGNSPREARERRGDELVLATTNGTPTTVAAAALSAQVVLACLLNLEAVRRRLRHVAARDDRRVQIACAGVQGAIAIEDVYVAGRLSGTLPGGRTEAAQVAEGVATALGPARRGLAAGAGAGALRAAGLEDDIADCACESRLDVVPRLVTSGPGWALLGAGTIRGAASGPVAPGPVLRAVVGGTSRFVTVPI